MSIDVGEEFVLDNMLSFPHEIAGSLLYQSGAEVVCILVGFLFNIFAKYRSIVTINNVCQRLCLQMLVLWIILGIYTYVIQNRIWLLEVRQLLEQVLEQSASSKILNEKTRIIEAIILVYVN